MVFLYIYIERETELADNNQREATDRQRRESGDTHTQKGRERLRRE